MGLYVIGQHWIFKKNFKGYEFGTLVTTQMQMSLEIVFRDPQADKLDGGYLY